MRPTAFACAAALLLGAGSLVHAASPSDEVQHYQDRAFACTGVGDDTRREPRWDGFPLKMVFTNRAGDYLADVQVTILDHAGDTMLEAHCGAPWLVADLDAGAYKALVTTSGAARKTVEFQVPARGQAEVVVTFADLSGT